MPIGYDIDVLLDIGPVRLGLSVLEHYKSLLKGIKLEYLIEALSRVYEDEDVLSRF